MKDLNTLEQEIKCLKDIITCQETGNDSYYISPLYHEHLIKLEALKNERAVLLGKTAPQQISFCAFPQDKREILDMMAQENGIWYANSCKNLTVDQLKHITQPFSENKIS